MRLRFQMQIVLLVKLYNKLQNLMSRFICHSMDSWFVKHLTMSSKCLKQTLIRYLISFIKAHPNFWSSWRIFGSHRSNKKSIKVSWKALKMPRKMITKKKKRRRQNQKAKRKKIRKKSKKLIVINKTILTLQHLPRITRSQCPKIDSELWLSVLSISQKWWTWTNNH